MVVPTLLKYCLLFVSLLCLVRSGQCQESCTQEFFHIDSAGYDLDSLTKQFIVPQYKFQCSAVVTAWEAIVTLHVEKVSPTIQFQVWRWNQSVSGYQLVGSNSFSTASAMLKETKYVYVVHLQALLHVKPNDTVGVFASGVRVHYERNDSINVYTADVDATFEGVFSPSNLDPVFDQRRSGAPLIAVQIDESAPDTAAIPHLVTPPGSNTTDSSRTPPFNATSNTETTSYGNGAADVSNRQMIIGVSISATALVLLCVTITILSLVLIVRVRRRKRVGIETTHRGPQERDDKICRGRDIFSFRNPQYTSAGSAARHILNGRSNGIHKAVLLTESHSANQMDSKEHSYAYINSEVISSGASPKPWHRVSTKPPTLPPARIAVGKNPCYSLTSATSTEELDVKLETPTAVAQGDDKRVENVYDLPVFPSQPRQAREYEVPIKTLSTATPAAEVAKPQQLQHIYELTDINEYV